MGEVVGRLRLAAGSEVGGRADDRHAQVRSDANGDHVPRDLFAQANAGVVAAGDDVGQPLLHRDLDLDVRVVRQQPLQRRPEDGFGGVLAGGDADGAGGLGAERAERIKARVDLLERWVQRLHQPLAGVGGRDAAGRPGQQTHAQPLFQPADGVAERRLGGPKLGRGAGEASLVRHGQEDAQVGQVFAAHS